jgi:hypothetical protein
MLEGVLEIGEDARLVEELGRLQLTQPATDRLFLLVRHYHEEGQREVLPDDRGNLEEPPLLRRQTVDARGQDGLHRVGHVDRRQVARQLVLPPVTRQRTRLDQRPDALLDEERITVGALDQ